MIAKEIEAIFAGQDVGDGEVDVDGVLKAFERLRSIATVADLPRLIAAIQSPRNNFWTRELFAEPISQLGGSDYLEPLFEAAQLGLDEGHDNDSFDTHLTEIAYAEPEKCRAKLQQLLARADFKHREAAEWLLEFCKTRKRDTIRSPDGKYSVELQDDYGEMGMGSPAFGHIIFRGVDVQFPDYLFGETIVFSPDSRFVALEQLVETRPFRTKLIAIELPRGVVHFVRLPPQGTARPQRWESSTRLIYEVWSVGSAAELQSWETPRAHGQ